MHQAKNTLPDKSFFEVEVTTYSHRWRDLSLFFKNMARECGVNLDVVAIPRGLFRIYHCTATGQRDDLEKFKIRWTENKKQVNLRRKL